MVERIAVIGLGYVGLPVAVGMARAHGHVVGYDLDPARVGALQRGEDATGEFQADELADVTLRYSADESDLVGCTCFILTVPTPIDGNRQPDLSAVRRACGTVACALAPGGLVVLESTVYPGVTEEVCGPLLAELTGLRQGSDFTLGYSPERINPGDREHRLESITKVVAGSDPATLARLVALYGPVAKRGLHQAPSIRVAETAKVIENTQRDLNIALHERALDHLRQARHQIRGDVLAAAAGTKWNFLPLQRPASSAVTASASTPTISPPRRRVSATTRRSSWPAGASTTPWAPSSPRSWSSC